jgi:putative cell wall-binding protein
VAIYGEGALVDQAASTATASNEEIEQFVASQKAVILLMNSSEQGRELTQPEKDYIAYMQELIFGVVSPELEQDTASSGALTTLGGSASPGDSGYVYKGPSVGVYPKAENFVKGRILITSDPAFGALPTGHAAITYSKESNNAVSALDSGVTLEDNDWDKRHATCFVVDVTSTTAAQDATIADWCYSQIGKPYNWNFINTRTRSSFYCSQLIWAGYLDVLGINIDTSFLGTSGVSAVAIVYPMELLDTPLTKLLYQHGISDTGWVTIGDQKYYLDLSGTPKTGRQTIGGSTYYFNSTGIMQTGLQTIGGYQYYFDPSTGRMRTGLIEIGGQSYYFNTLTGRREIPFTRLDGAGRYDTMKMIATYNRTSATTAIVVSGAANAWTDALSAAGLAGIYDAPILTTASGSLSPQAKQALVTLGVKKVFIIGGTAMVSNTVKNQITNVVGSDVTRIAGANRYETAEKIYEAVSATSWQHPAGGDASSYSSPPSWKNGTGKKAAILVTGTSFPDGLSASALAAYAHFPIFLVQSNGKLTAATQNILAKGNFDEIIAVGGATTAAAEVACNLIDPADAKGMAPGKNWYHRAIGADRYQTSGEVFKVCAREGVPLTEVIITTGISSIDATAGGALKYPILLANIGKTSAAAGITSAYKDSITKLLVLGGTSAVFNTTVTAVATWS